MKEVEICLTKGMENGTLNGEFQIWKDEVTAKMGRIQTVLDLMPAKTNGLCFEPVSCERIMLQIWEQLKTIEFVVNMLDKKLDKGLDLAK